MSPLLLLAAAHASTLTITGTCGGPADVDITGLTPGGKFAVLKAEDVGAANLIGPCAATVSGLDSSFRPLTIQNAPASGELHLGVNLPASFCGDALQVVEIPTCDLSNVVEVQGTDADGDGSTDAYDCDDADPHTYPGAPELCDGVQNDCDDTGWVNDDGQVSWFGADGSVRSFSAAANAGTPANPRDVDPPAGESGTLMFCDGTYYVNVDASPTSQSDVRESFTLAGTSRDAVFLVGDSVRAQASSIAVQDIDLTMAMVSLFATDADSALSIDNATIDAFLNFDGPITSISDSIVGDLQIDTRGTPLPPIAQSVTIANTDFVSSTANPFPSNVVNISLYSDGVDRGSVVIEGSSVVDKDLYVFQADASIDDTTITAAASSFGALQLHDTTAALQGVAIDARAGLHVFRDSSLTANVDCDDCSLTGTGSGDLDAIYVSNATLTLNASSVTGWDSNGDVISIDDGGTLELVGSAIVDNVGRIESRDSSATATLSCTNSSITGNTTASVGLVRMPSIQSNNCDWGTGANDNSPADISMWSPTAYPSTYSYGLGATFVCDTSTCF